MYLCSYPSLACGVVMRIGGFLEISEDKRIEQLGVYQKYDDTRQLTFEIFRSTTPPKDPSPLLLCDASYDRLS